MWINVSFYAYKCSMNHSSTRMGILSALDLITFFNFDHISQFRLWVEKQSLLTKLVIR